MLKQRVLTAVLLLALLTCALYVGVFLLAPLAVIVYLVLVYETARNIVSLPQPFVYLSLLGHAGTLASFIVYGSSSAFCVFLVYMLLNIATLIVFIEKEDHQPLLDNLVPGAMLVSVYPGLFAMPLIITATRPFATWAFCWLFSVTIASDTFAYFVGRAIGGRKLAPRISPSKTASGAIGGFIAALSCGVFVFLYFSPQFYATSGFAYATFIFRAVFLSALGAILVQFGDLAESMLKRTYGIKDSGAILPGHGGLFDRVDGLLFAAPILLFL